MKQIKPVDSSVAKVIEETSVGPQQSLTEEVTEGKTQLSHLAAREGSNEEQLQCDPCSERVRLLENIVAHVYNKRHRCKDCGKGFYTSRHLRDHIRIHTGEKPFSCPICRRNFSQSSSMRRHVRSEVCKKKLFIIQWI